MDIETLTAATRAVRQTALVPLVGTEKQTAWAAQVRAQALTTLQAEADSVAAEDAGYIARKRTAGDEAAAIRATERAIGAAAEYARAETGLRAVTSAAWWIGHRLWAGNATELWRAGRTLEHGGNPA